MIFSIRYAECIYKILNELNKKNENYAYLYREIKSSHETLQKSLKDLLIRNLIFKENKGHKKSQYKITGKGKEYLLLLNKLIEYE